MRNNRGPDALPCGTPARVLSLAETEPPLSAPELFENFLVRNQIKGLAKVKQD